MLCSPPVVTWCKAFDTGSNSSINQVFLGLLVGIGKSLDEGQNGMNSTEGYNQTILVIVVYLLPM